MLGIIIGAIIASVFLGYKTKINTGLFGMVFAYLIGCFALNLTPREVIRFWPVTTMFVIFAVSVFYNVAVINGTMDKVAQHLFYKTRHFPSLLPYILFIVSMLIAGVGCFLSSKIPQKEHRISPLSSGDFPHF